jgi:two-component sensor histidine kinase
LKDALKNLIQITAIFLLVVLTCPKANAEPMEPILLDETAANLISQLHKRKPNKDLADDLLRIAAYYLFTYDEESKKYIDQSHSLSEKLSYKEGIIRSMCLQAGYLKLLRNDENGGNNLIEEALLLSRKSNNPKMEAYVYYYKGYCKSITDLDLALECFTKSRNLYKLLGDKVKEAFLIKCIANILFLQNKFSQSLEALFQALEHYKKAQYPNLHYTYDLIGSVYRAMGNYKEALHYSLLAIKSAERTKDTTDIGLFHLRVANLFKDMGRPEEAIEYYRLTLQKSRNIPKNYNLLRYAHSNVATMLIQTGKPEEALLYYKKIMAENPAARNTQEYSIDQQSLGDIYLSLKENDKAEKHYLEMLNHDNNDSHTQGFDLIAFLRLGNFYISEKRFSKAKEFIQKAETSAALKSKFNISNLYLQKFKVDSASHNYLAAIKHYQMYKTLNDSMFDEKKENQIASMHIQYQTEKKLQEIQTLTARNSEQQAILEKHLFEQNVFTAGALMLLLLLLLSINRYQIKRQANRQLQQQQEIIHKKNEILNGLLEEKEELLASKDKLIKEKECLVKEVHHRVKNNLQMISTLLYSQASYLKDKAALAAISESQQRIHAISLIHQKLYQSDNLQVVNMKSYIHELVDYLKESFNAEQKIEFNIKVDSIEMEILKAIPVGLILNEAITNSLKYAFDGEDQKIISIQLKHKKNNSISLTIKDNGKGIPADFNPLESDSLGINLMQGLSNQINADFSIKADNGTSIKLEFSQGTPESLQPLT